MRKFLLFTLLLLLGVASYAQVTTSSLTGIVKDSKGETLIGATVKATHQPTGTTYGTSTNVDGRFNIANMRVGGPYLITISYIGFRSESYKDIYLKLGEPYVVSSVLNSGDAQLMEVIVVGTRDPLLNSKKTGASTNISKEQLERLPTISRSLQDFTRITPQANGNSFGSVSNKYNNITIDGAVNNDVFQASTGSFTPGATAGTQPISLDAIQEIQVVLAPYDVSFGNFTGAGVNAVTRSGTNKFEGSVYFFGRNEQVTGKNVLTNIRSTDYTDNQYGVRIGGPVIKDKLFFFVNYEQGRRIAPISNNAGDAGAAITNPTARAIADSTKKFYNYDPGNYASQDLGRENDKLFLKFDYNLDSRNQLTARYNYINAFDDNLTRSATFFNFANNGYKFKNKQHIGIIELRSNFNTKVSNNLILGYSYIRDKRATLGALFPSVTIQNIESVSGVSAEFGSQRSSVANELDQDIFEITDNLKLNIGKHNFTFGTHNEFFKFRNLFINNVAGRWTFSNLSDYLNNLPSNVQATVSRIPGETRPAAQFSAAQLSVYGQDEFEAFKGFRVTGGIRFDLPVFNDKPLRNPQIEASFPGYRTDKTPRRQPLVSPRLGFNYDVFGNRSLQLRGGTGIFTGRVPFVWLSNQYGNSGMFFSTININRTGTSGTVNPNLKFISDPNKQASAGAGSNRAEVNLIADDFKIPQVFRSNLAADYKLPYGIIATVEGIYSKTLNNIVYKDINLRPSTGTLNPILSNGADLRPIYAGRVDNANFSNVLLLDNTSKGYTYNLTGQLQKNFNFGLSTMVAYTYSDAKSVSDGTSSTALSNWEFVQIVNDPNNPPLTTSYYLTKHRVIGSFGYNIKYGKTRTFGTGIALFYAGTSGQRYTYLVNGNLNSDSGPNNGNDLFYVPRNQSEIKLNTIPAVAATSTLPAVPAITPDQQWAALNAFIESDPYLRTRRGQYTERNGAETPFQHQFDLRISQDLGGVVKGTQNKIQITLDIFNIGNMINKDWGRQYFVTNQAYSVVSVSNPTLATGGYTFRAPSNGKGYQTSAFGSAWSGQFGVRYLFN